MISSLSSCFPALPISHLVPLTLRLEAPPDPRVCFVYVMCQLGNHKVLQFWAGSGSGGALMPGGELGPGAGACAELSLTQAGKVQRIPLLERGQ